jgi:hypothetical protein
MTCNTFNNKKSEPIDDNGLLIESYSNSSDVIDSIENLSIKYYDTANVEMLHYVIHYSEQNIKDFPDYYVTNFDDTIYYNKENFFKYIALYTVANNLLESRKHIINGLLINSKIEEIKGIKEKAKE